MEYKEKERGCETFGFSFVLLLPRDGLRYRFGGYVREYQLTDDDASWNRTPKMYGWMIDEREQVVLDYPAL